MGAILEFRALNSMIEWVYTNSNRMEHELNRSTLFQTDWSQFGIYVRHSKDWNHLGAGIILGQVYEIPDHFLKEINAD